MHVLINARSYRERSSCCSTSPITVRIPHDVNPEKIKQLGGQEHERAADLQRQGKWLHLWRVVGKFTNVSIFDVESPAELHEILESLPLHPYMEVEVTALCRQSRIASRSALTIGAGPGALKLLDPEIE